MKFLNMQKILLVTDRALHPVDRGNRRRIVNLAEGLRSLGFYLVLVTLESVFSPISAIHFDEVVLAGGSQFKSGDSPSSYRAPELNSAIVNTALRLSACAVIVEYIFLAHCLSGLPQWVLRIIDTHDVMSVRSSFDPHWVFCNITEERLLLQNADVVIAIQHQEADLLRGMLGHNRVIVAGHNVPNAFVDSSYLPRSRNVLIIGSDHPGNDGIVSFCEHLWREVVRMVPDATLTICGNICNRIFVDDPSISLHGYVETLKPFYERSSLIAAPLWQGTGLKIKIVEALASGKILITTPTGVQGLNGALLRGAVVCHTPTEFLRSTVDQLSRNDDIPDSLSSPEESLSQLGPSVVLRELVNILHSWTA